MNRQKLLILCLIANIFFLNNNVFCAEIKKQNNSPSGQLKGGVVDYKAEFINKDWWNRFNDPNLTEYIIKTVNANHDLKIATLKVAESRAFVQESFQKEFPLLYIGPDFGLEKTSGNARMGTFKLPEITQNTYMLPLTMNYEVDLWRKNREKTIGLEKELEAAQYDEKAAYISLTSDVAAAYFNIIKADKLIFLQKEIIDLKENILNLTKEKNNYGLCSAFEVIQADKALTEAHTYLNDLEKQQCIFLNQLAVLTGGSVDNASTFKRTPIDELDLLKDLPANIQPDTVLKRPDILKAEAKLQKSGIDVKVARKELLPCLILTGQFGFNANSLAKIFNWKSYVASVGTNFLQSVLSGGRIAVLKAKKINYEEMIENYQKTILQSFQEVNNSLVSLKTDTQKNTDNISRVNLEKDNLNLVNCKYENGLISFLDTLEYKERLIQLEKEQVQSKTDCFIDSISLYKSVGGRI